MSYRGMVRNGKIELDPPAELPEGTLVNVEVTIEDWIAEMKKLGEEVSQATPQLRSVLDGWGVSRG